MIWCSDFETVNDPNDCRVWSWKSITIDESFEKTGLSIEEFISWIETLGNGDCVYFHNLKFDGEFIVYYLLSHNWELLIGNIRLRKSTFKTVISDMGQWYSIQLMTSKGKRITIKDSAKIWTSSIKEIAKSFKMDIQKGEIDYDLYREPGYQPTPEEWDYVDRDVRIACRAMRLMINEGYTKLTAGANALWDYRMLIGKKFEYYFPPLDDSIDTFCRQSYRGGWCYANPLYRNQEIGEGIVLDVNSLYPSRMYSELLPYGTPIYYEGKYKNDEKYPIYIMHAFIDFRLKPTYFPTVQKKHTMRFANTEYITSTNGDPLELTMTSVDWDIFQEHYEIITIEYLDGYKFKGTTELFKNYVDKWMKLKEESTINGDKARRALAKLFQNSLYGKFAKRPYGQSKYPYIGEDERLHFELGEMEDRGSLYIPVGTFITAYARAYTIRSAQVNHDRFLYADTDSLHLIGKEIPADIEVHPTKLGAWKHESTFRRAKYIGAKAYCEDLYVSHETLDEYLAENPLCVCHVNYDNGTLLSITCAGMPDRTKYQVNFDNFSEGLVVDDKLTPKHVKGGQVLVKTTFEIKKR